MENKRISPLIILPPLIFLGLAFLFILGVKRENPNDLPSVFIDQPAPNITESPLNGFDPVLPSEITRPNFNDKEKNAKSYLLESGNPFSSIAFDPSGKTAIDWGVTAPPETFILNSQGVVIFRFAGPLVGTDYENRFEPALKKALEQ